MTAFIVACALLSIATLFWVGRPLWQARRLEQQEIRSLRQTNTEALEAQLTELQQEYAAGRLDEAAYKESEQELAARLLEEGAAGDEVATSSAAQPLLFGTLAVLVIALTVGLYLDIGSPTANEQQAVKALDTTGSTDISPEQAEARVAELRQQLEKDARDMPAWIELARLERRLSDTAAASRSYQHAIMLANDDGVLTDLQLEMVETLALHAEQQGGGIPPVAHTIIKDVLSRHAEHPRALWYGAMLAEGAGDRATAIGHLQKLLSLGPPEQIRAALEQQLAAWQAAAPADQQPQPSEPSAGASSRVISIEVDILNGVDVGNTNAATLFVYARPVDGSRMPLAVWREESPIFPLQATLDDSMAMMPGTELGAHDKLELIARISFTGNAISSPGDWFGSVVVGQDTDNFTIDIDQQVE